MKTLMVKLPSSRLCSPIVFCSVLALSAVTGSAHHAVTGKFDDTRPMTLNGVVTRVDWRNPHVHVFVNVGRGEELTTNWAVELESPITLNRSGWSAESLRPGDAITVQGMAARDGSRQVWGESVVFTDTGRPVLYAKNTAPVPPEQARPTPRWPDGVPRLGATDAQGGYWGYPSETALVEEGVDVAMNAHGLLENIEDAPRVAPLQPWALALYEHRQRRHLRDDPTYLNCKPSGGVRHLQSPFGIQIAEDRKRERIFVVLGSGNHNYRIIYLDGREQRGQVGGDDNNPLYYGRSVGRWEGDTLVVNTADFNEDFWFTRGGLPHTSQLQLIERFSRPDYDRLRYEVTIQDPGAYTRSWTASWELRWVGGERLPSHFCQENRS